MYLKKFINLFLITTFIAQAQELIQFENSPKVSAGMKNANFELRNQYDKPIEILLYREDLGGKGVKYLSNFISLPAMRRNDIATVRGIIKDIQNPFYVVIKYYVDFKENTEAYYITAKKGQTAFVTYDTEGVFSKKTLLRPQKGTGGNTQSGLSLQNNIKANNIQRAKNFSLVEESPYDILGIPHNATKTQIRRAFGELSKIHHPDKPTGNTAVYQKIVEAYEKIK